MKKTHQKVLFFVACRKYWDKINMFFKKRFIWKPKLYREKKSREWWRIFILWFAAPMVAMVWSALGWSLESVTPSWSPSQGVGLQVLGPSSSFLGTLVESWTGNRTAGTQTGPLIFDPSDTNGGSMLAPWTSFWLRKHDRDKCYREKKMEICATDRLVPVTWYSEVFLM